MPQALASVPVHGTVGRGHAAPIRVWHVRVRLRVRVHVYIRVRVRVRMRIRVGLRVRRMWVLWVGIRRRVVDIVRVVGVHREKRSQLVVDGADKGGVEEHTTGRI